MEKAILFGNYDSYDYHPLSGVDKEIQSILHPVFEVFPTQDEHIFKPDNLSSAQLLILYGDQWDNTIKTDYMASIISFVCNGGALLVIHNGISFQKHFEFVHMVGGKFTHHPKIRNLTMKPVGSHLVMDGLKNMVIFDEPYQFSFSSFTEKNVFLEYEMDGLYYPAGWSVNYCKGKIIYLMPGHTVESFKNETYRKIIFNSAKWVRNG